MLGTILLVILILLLVGALPTWGWSGNWGGGYGPPGIVGVPAHHRDHLAPYGAAVARA